MATEGIFSRMTTEATAGEQPYFYRNKVQMPFSYNKKAICGYYKKKSHEVVPIDKCYLQPDEITEMIKFIRNMTYSFYSFFNHLFLIN